MTAPTKCSKVVDLSNARTAQVACWGQATGTSGLPVLHLPRCPAHGGWSSSWNVLLYQGAWIGRKNESGIAFGHLGNAADSLNAASYTQGKSHHLSPVYTEKQGAMVHTERVHSLGHLKRGPEGYRPLIPASLKANESCAPYRGVWHQSPQLPLYLRSVVTVKEGSAILCTSSTDAREYIVNTRC